MKKIVSLLLIICLTAACVIAAAAETRLRGDLNGNGKIDITDYAMIKRAVIGTYKLSEAKQKLADINDNGKVDLGDYAMAKRDVLGTYTVTDTVDYDPAADESSAIEYGPGSGTQSDPYNIRNAADLKNVANHLNRENVWFRQVADIDLTGVDWTPIGDFDHPFSGHYDGVYYTIENLKVKGDNEVGLFGCTMHADIKNVRLNNLSYQSGIGSSAGGLIGAAYVTKLYNCSASGVISAYNGVGLLVGSYYGDVTGTTVIEKCFAEGKVVNGGQNVGGLIGYVGIYTDEIPSSVPYEQYGVDIADCSAYVTLENCSSTVGGLIGYYDAGKMTGCRASGSITSNNGNCRGGLIGEIGSYGEISRCSAAVGITTYGTGYGDAHCGGLIGRMMSFCTVHDCCATGDISCAGTWSSCQDSTSYNGGLWYNYRNPCGSLIGMLRTSGTERKINVYNCFASGAVTVPDVCEQEEIYCKGSMIGLIFDASTLKLIKDEYRVKPSTEFNAKYDIDVTESMLNGNMIGNVSNNYCVSEFRDYYTPQNYFVMNSLHNAYIGQYRSLPTYKYVNNIRKSAVSNAATFSGFDFTKIWKMTSEGPALR